MRAHQLATRRTHAREPVFWQMGERKVKLMQTWGGGGNAAAMQRRRLDSFSWMAVLLSLVIGAVSSRTWAQETVPAPALAAEPTYTARFADKKTARLYLSVVTNPQSGEKRVRIGNLTGVKSELLLEASLTTDSTNVPQRVRMRFGEMPTVGESAPELTDLEATPLARTAWVVRRPAQSGVIRFSGPLLSSPASLLFFGRSYNFKQGGAQTATFLSIQNTPTPQTFNLTLTDGGKETISLGAGGDAQKVQARKLLYKAPDAPNLNRREREGVIYVGPIGEVLRCDTRLFGNRIRAEGAAKRTDSNGYTLELQGRDITIVGERKPDGWDVKFNVGKQGNTVGAAQLDTQLRILSMAGGRNMKQVATVVNNEILWKSDEGGASDVVVPDGKLWLLPHWFATDLWEAGSNAGDFALNVDAEQSGLYLPLFTGQRDGYLFTIKRLRDFGKVDGTTVRRYRFTSRNIYEIYTDGTRLIYFAGSDGTTITRDGWAIWASGLPRVVKPNEPATPETEAERRRRGRRPRNP